MEHSEANAALDAETAAGTTAGTGAAPAESGGAGSPPPGQEPGVEAAEAATQTTTGDEVETLEVPADSEPVLPEMAAEQLIAGQEQPAAAEDEAVLKAVLEAVIYITEEPLSLAQIAAALERPAETVKQVLEALIEDYNRPERGISIREVAGGYKMGTKPEHHEAVRTFVKNLKPPLKLSLAALETLAVIAYKQPITAPEILEIRGVQGAGVLKTLLDRKLITTAGRKQVIGKPILYKTTREFLLQFGLKDLAELPTLKEFEELRRLALTDTEEAPAEAVPAPAGPEGVGAPEAALSEAAAEVAEPQPETAGAPPEDGQATEPDSGPPAQSNE